MLLSRVYRQAILTSTNMGIHVLLIILLSFPLVSAQASPPNICAAGTIARTVSALSGYRPASSFCSSRFGTTVRQTRTLKAVATLTITSPMTINVTATSRVTLTVSCSSFFPNHSGIAYFLDAHTSRRKRRARAPPRLGWCHGDGLIGILMTKATISSSVSIPQARITV